jgi:hypothetical protein
VSWMHTVSMRFDSSYHLSAKLIFESSLTEEDKPKVTYIQVKTFTKVLPVCIGCKKIRNDKGKWEEADTYLMTHARVLVTHGVCPACTRQLFSPEMAEEILKDE